MDNFAEVVIPKEEEIIEEETIIEEEPIEPIEHNEPLIPVEIKEKVNPEEIFVRTSKKKPLEIEKVKDKTDLIKDKVLKLPKNNKKIYQSILEQNNIKFAKSISIDKLRQKIIDNEIDFDLSKINIDKEVKEPKEPKEPKEVKEVKEPKVKAVKKSNTLNINEPYSKKDLENMVFNGIQQYEAVRKERKKDKLKQKEIDNHQQKVQETINKALHTPNDIYSKCFNF
jgi:hypothetical protein